MLDQDHRDRVEEDYSMLVNYSIHIHYKRKGIDVDVMLALVKVFPLG